MGKLKVGDLCWELYDDGTPTGRIVEVKAFVEFHEVVYYVDYISAPGTQSVALIRHELQPLTKNEVRLAKALYE